MRKLYFLLGVLLCTHFSLVANDSETCNVYSGGTNSVPTSVCFGEAFTIGNLKSGSSAGTTEYAWVISYDGPTWNAEEMEYTNSSYYTTNISQSTWFRRCASSEACGNIDAQESNWYYVEVNNQTIYSVYNEGNCDVDIYWWVFSGDQYYGTISVGNFNQFNWSEFSNYSTII